VDTNGLVYIANEGNGRVEVFKEDGSFVRQIGVGQLERPCNVTIYGDRLFIPDTANHRVLTFNTSGELTQTIGGPGGGPGQFRGPTAVAVYNNELFITDYNNRVQVFSVNGQYNRELLRGQVRGPEDILITPDGEVLIADLGNHRVDIFNTSGDLLHRLDVPGPRCLAINTNSELLVTGEDGVCVFT
jgi:sugar lactone lactonase YvrE